MAFTGRHHHKILWFVTTLSKFTKYLPSEDSNCEVLLLKTIIGDDELVVRLWVILLLSEKREVVMDAVFWSCVENLRDLDEIVGLIDEIIELLFLQELLKALTTQERVTRESIFLIV